MIAKVIALFDIEDIDCVFENNVYHGMAYRNWELRRNLKNNGLFVTSKWAYADETDPAKRVRRNHVELPYEMRKLFTAQVMELLKPFCEGLKDEPPSF